MRLPVMVLFALLLSSFSQSGTAQEFFFDTIYDLEIRDKNGDVTFVLVPEETYDLIFAYNGTELPIVNVTTTDGNETHQMLWNQTTNTMITTSMWSVNINDSFISPTINAVRISFTVSPDATAGTFLFWVDIGLNVTEYPQYRVYEGNLLILERIIIDVTSVNHWGTYQPNDLVSHDVEVGVTTNQAWNMTIYASPWVSTVELLNTTYEMDNQLLGTVNPLWYNGTTDENFALRFTLYIPDNNQTGTFTSTISFAIEYGDIKTLQAVIKIEKPVEENDTSSSVGGREVSGYVRKNGGTMGGKQVLIETFKDSALQLVETSVNTVTDSQGFYLVFINMTNGHFVRSVVQDSGAHYSEVVQVNAFTDFYILSIDVEIDDSNFTDDILQIAPEAGLFFGSITAIILLIRRYLIKV